MVVLSFSLALLYGCVPYVTTYPKIDGPGATYLNPNCSGGPASLTYYPFHGIYISLDMRDSRLGLHVPSGAIVELNGKIMKIDGMIGMTPYHATFELRAAPHASIGSSAGPADWMVVPDRYTTPDNFGPLYGGGGGKYPVWYLYLPMEPQDPQRIAVLPKGLTEGTIEIPAMTINGERYDAQKLKFTQKTYVGMTAVNC